MLLGIFSSQKHWQQISTCQLDIKNGFLICDEEDELTKMAMTQFFPIKEPVFHGALSKLRVFPLSINCGTKEKTTLHQQLFCGLW